MRRSCAFERRGVRVKPCGERDAKPGDGLKSVTA